MEFRKKYGLTVLSIILWAQLVFSIGITAWRYWLIQTGEAELFVSSSPTSSEPIIRAARDYCPDQADIIFLGDENSYYYTRYQLFPGKVVRLPLDRFSGLSPDEAEELLRNHIQARSGDVCLLADRLPERIRMPGERFPVNPSQAVYVYRK